MLCVVSCGNGVAKWPTRRMIDDVIILVLFFNFSAQITKTHKTNPMEGNFDIDAGDGDGGGI